MAYRQPRAHHKTIIGLFPSVHMQTGTEVFSSRQKVVVDHNSCSFVVRSNTLCKHPVVKSTILVQVTVSSSEQRCARGWDLSQCISNEIIILRKWFNAGFPP